MEGQKNPWKQKVIKDMKSHQKLKVIESQKNQWKQKEIKSLKSHWKPKVIESLKKPLKAANDKALKNKSNKKLNGMKSQIEIIMGNFKIGFLHKLGWTVNFHKNI